MATTTRATAAAAAGTAVGQRLSQHLAELGAEAEHQDEVGGRVEDDEDVGDGGELLQPARELVDGECVDGVEHEAEQRHGAADGEHEHYHQRQHGRAQLPLDPSSTGPVSSSHPRRHARHPREDATRTSRVSGDFAVQLAARLPD